MIKNTVLTILAVSIVTVLISVSPAHPSSYAISQITDNSYEDYSPQINSSGYVVWYGNGEIFLYDGTSIRQITDNPYGGGFMPQINDNGYVVWVGDDATDDEIFLYDGIGIRQLTDNSYYDYSPQINNNGYVVWSADYYEIFLYDGISIKQITDSSYHDMYPQMVVNAKPQINNNGYVVWESWDVDGIDHQIFLYDGIGITQITDNHGGYDPQINDNGYVVWYRWDFNGGDYEIFLYDGISIKQITNNSYDDWTPQINNNGYVVWEGSDGSDHEIFLYDGTGIKQISNNSYEDWNPQINNNGYVVWEGYDSHDTEVFLYNGTSTIQITDNAYADDYPQLNDKGDIVWHGFISGAEIFIATPIVKLLYPNGSEIIPSGSTYTIIWEAAKEAVKFDIFYSLNNGAIWNPIASKVTGTSYTWTVPKPLKNKKNCLVKVIGYDAADVKVGEDTSDGTFTIEVVKVTSPDGGENWKVGSTHAITWITNGTKKPVAEVKLFYTYNGGATWILIHTFNDNPGVYNWRASANSANCKVKVVLKNASGKTIGTDVSDHVFTISP